MSARARPKNYALSDCPGMLLKETSRSSEKLGFTYGVRGSGCASNHLLEGT